MNKYLQAFLIWIIGLLYWSILLLLYNLIFEDTPVKNMLEFLSRFVTVLIYLIVYMGFYTSPVMLISLIAVRVSKNNSELRRNYLSIYIFICILVTSLILATNEFNSKVLIYSGLYLIAVIPTILWYTKRK